MTRNLTRSLALLGFGLTLSACANHQPLAANCFDADNMVTRSAGFADGVLSTRNAPVTRRDSGCDFTRLGTAN